MQAIGEVKQILEKIYGTRKGRRAQARILPRIENFPIKHSQKEGYFSQADVVLITYGDTLTKAGEKPLTTLHGFAEKYLRDSVSTIHFLPFFPFSSDDGFSVTDFFSINPALGSWESVSRFAADFQLMFDFVINHFSAQGQWFQFYLEGQKGYTDFAIEVDPSTDLSMVTRPRSLPLLTAFTKSDGQTVHLWTTFSEDQIDFNYKSLDVLEKMIEALIFYINKGASVLRLDAIAYLWKEIGTSCIHLPQTHDMVKLFRKILDIIAPQVVLITETNVPHHENISYFGNGRDEAQMVYNFTLPPLLFYSFAKQDASILSRWAKGLRLESESTTFFNFTASHDGIGVRPLEGILPGSEIERLIDIVKANGGQVSYKRNPDGSESPYELNITYIDAILADNASNRADKFLASQAIQYSLPGVPATYIHSLLGSRNWQEGVSQTGRARTINREKLTLEEVEAELDDPDSFRAAVFFPYLNLIKTRKKQAAFHPNARFEIMDIHPAVFAIKRQSNDQTVVALTNTSSKAANVSLKDFGESDPMTDVLTGAKFNLDSFDLKPYQYVWLSDSK
ncbi:MAG: alpha-amylase family glycosyl hydrolase [Desulfobacterales bacterium]|jgi:sucrose phosphorylase